jgi:K+/H+ antiporter YhaU regulatory subunit KhtT
MLREKEQNLRLEQIAIVAGTQAAGRPLRDIALGKDMRALVVAIRLQQDGDYMYNPEPDFVLEPGMLLVAMGDSASLVQLRARAAA